ncbi:MAG TPA: YceI family protein [Polyangiaceae bacterium]|jgi:polyisoprenoid-binding protein YceI
MAPFSTSVRSLAFACLLLVAALTSSSRARATGGLPAAGDYDVQPAGSSVGFSVTNFLVTTVDGTFHTFRGKVTIGDSIAATRIEASADTRSVDTGNGSRDEHLRSADFFDSAKFPRMSFTSTQVWGTPDNLGIKGSLTIKGTTREVVFSARILDSGVVRAEATIDRTAFGITYGASIKNDVRLKLMIKMAKG